MIWSEAYYSSYTCTTPWTNASNYFYGQQVIIVDVQDGIHGHEQHLSHHLQMKDLGKT